MYEAKLDIKVNTAENSENRHLFHVSILQKNISVDRLLLLFNAKAIVRLRKAQPELNFLKINYPLIDDSCWKQWGSKKLLYGAHTISTNTDIYFITVQCEIYKKVNIAPEICGE